MNEFGRVRNTSSCMQAHFAHGAHGKHVIRSAALNDFSAWGTRQVASTFGAWSERDHTSFLKLCDLGPLESKFFGPWTMAGAECMTR